MIGYRKALLGILALVGVLAPSWWVMLRTMGVIDDNSTTVITESIGAVGIVMGVVCAGYGAEYALGRIRNRKGGNNEGFDSGGDSGGV